MTTSKGPKQSFIEAWMGTSRFELCFINRYVRNRENTHVGSLVDSDPECICAAGGAQRRTDILGSMLPKRNGDVTSLLLSERRSYPHKRPLTGREKVWT